MKAHAAKQQTRFRVQGYGIPPATLSSNRFADLPEGEGYQWRTLTSSRGRRRPATSTVFQSRRRKRGRGCTRRRIARRRST